MDEAERAVGNAQEQIGEIFMKWEWIAKDMAERGGGLSSCTALAEIREEIAAVMERLRGAVTATRIRGTH